MYQERPSRVPGAVVWSRTSTGAAGPNRVLPDGCMDLLWRNGDLLVAGPDTRAHEVTDDADWIGLRFFPGTAPAVLGVPAHELRNQRVHLADLWPSRTVRHLAAQVSDAAEAADAGAALEAVTLRRLADAPAPDRACAAAVEALAEGVPVAAAARRAYLSERQLHRRFLADVGYGPKTLARVLRLHRALGLARAGTPLATVAVMAGYTDQPHLSREVRELAGLPLRQILSA